MALTSHDPVPTQVLDGAVKEYSRDKVYVLTALFLGAITFVEIMTYAQPDFVLWKGNLVVAVLLILMAVKFFTVAYIFMHLRFDKPILTWALLLRAGAGGAGVRRRAVDVPHLVARPARLSRLRHAPSSTQRPRPAGALSRAARRARTGPAVPARPASSCCARPVTPLGSLPAEAAGWRRPAWPPPRAPARPRPLPRPGRHRGRQLCITVLSAPAGVSSPTLASHEGISENGMIMPPSSSSTR